MELEGLVCFLLLSQYLLMILFGFWPLLSYNVS